MRKFEGSQSEDYNSVNHHARPWVDNINVATHMLPRRADEKERSSETSQNDKPGTFNVGTPMLY